MFEIDFNSVIVWLLPRKLRDAFNVAWLKALVSPIVTLYNDFQTYRNDVLYKLDHNSQVVYIEAVLNDAFDPEERRIYLSDAGGDFVTLINRDSDLDSVLINQDSDGNTLLVHPDSAYAESEFDFVINIPYQYTEAEIYRLKALVDYYKLAGKRYDIIVNI